MNARSILGSALFAASMLLFGCKSPTGASEGGVPTITIEPENFRGQQFIQYTFKAKIINHDPEFTYLTWYIEGTTDSVGARSKINDPIYEIWNNPGTYTLRLKAHDYYTDSIIATASEKIIIDTAISSVEIIPQFYNGALSANLNGNFDPFSLSVRTSIPDNEVYEFWDFGDGTTDAFISGPTTHVFTHPGTFLIKADLYQKNGIYVGTDTTLITINLNLPPISVSDVRQVTRAEVYVVVDSSYAIFPNANLPITLGIGFTGQNITSNWNGNNFSLDFYDFYDDLNIMELKHFQISGTVSEDARSIISMHVSAVDSFFNKHSASCKSYRYDFDASNMFLSTVQSNFIIYRLRGDAMKNNFSNSDMVTSGGVHNGFSAQPPSGAPSDNSETFIDNLKFPQCILVFAKN
jgi:hypothetical protein